MPLSWISRHLVPWSTVAPLCPTYSEVLDSSRCSLIVARSRGTKPSKRVHARGFAIPCESRRIRQSVDTLYTIPVGSPKICQ
ncbi:hypothetical protein F5Y13DRAFT_93410 [Hypoxylon sp. FL1857]|nr:hypothetical protein F5Y13DRAFT_93410 [Hypoxylon sp. FL1857]